MSSPQLAVVYAPLSLVPVPSWWLATGLILTSIFTLIIVITLPFALLIRLTIITIVLFLIWLELRLHVRRDLSWAITKVTWDTEGKWNIHLVSGIICAANLADDSFVTLPLVILNFHLLPPCKYNQWYSWQHRSLVLTADSCDLEILRCLRVRLRLEHYKS